VGGAGRCVGTYVCPGCRRDRHLRDSGIGRHPPNIIVNNGTKVGGSITMGQLLGPRLQQLIAAAAGTADPPDELQLNPVLHEGLFLSTYILDVERMLALRRLRENNHKRQRQADTANEFSIAASAETEQPALGSEDLCFSCKDGASYSVVIWRAAPRRTTNTVPPTCSEVSGKSLASAANDSSFPSSCHTPRWTESPVRSGTVLPTSARSMAAVRQSASRAAGARPLGVQPISWNTTATLAHCRHLPTLSAKMISPLWHHRESCAACASGYSGIIPPCALPRRPR
jgi:hypothetical protein